MLVAALHANTCHSVRTIYPMTRVRFVSEHSKIYFTLNNVIQMFWCWCPGNALGINDLINISFCTCCLSLYLCEIIDTNLESDQSFWVLHYEQKLIMKPACILYIYIWKNCLPTWVMTGWWMLPANHMPRFRELSLHVSEAFCYGFLALWLYEVLISGPVFYVLALSLLSCACSWAKMEQAQLDPFLSTVLGVCSWSQSSLTHDSRSYF